MIPSAEKGHLNNGSYPSGHTVCGWGMALLLAEINPAAQDALLKYGYEWGQSRVIAGKVISRPPRPWLRQFLPA